MIENKQAFLNEFVKLLQMTELFGDERNNRLVELRYLRNEHNDEIVRPIFEDGTGEDGWYDIRVNMDSCSAMIGDIYKQFISSF